MEELVDAQWALVQLFVRQSKPSVPVVEAEYQLEFSRVLAGIGLTGVCGKITGEKLGVHPSA